jgi:delta(3,5)-delta(2,4)-dienoyl-CoA isomerase
LEFPKPEIAVVTLNRPKQLNAMSWQMFEEQVAVFNYINDCREVRVVILKANGKAFSSGLDIMDANENVFGRVQEQSEDVGRRGILYHKILQDLQDGASSPENCRVPVIAAVHGYCIGAGIDISAACDIRLCTKDAKFTIKEVDIGLAADLGTLQRFPKVVGNNSWVRELAHTARFFDGQEALEHGFVSH